MPRNGVVVEGVEDLSKQLNSIHGALAARLLRQSLGRAGTPIVQEARLRIPYGKREMHRTYLGNLVFAGFAKRSIKKSTRVTRSGLVDVAITTKKEAFYATQFVELGTSKMDAQPWLVPALEAAADRAIAIFGRSVKQKIEKAIGPRKS